MGAASRMIAIGGLQIIRTLSCGTIAMSMMAKRPRPQISLPDYLEGSVDSFEKKVCIPMVGSVLNACQSINHWPRMRWRRDHAPDKCPQGDHTNALHTRRSSMPTYQIAVSDHTPIAYMR